MQEMVIYGVSFDMVGKQPIVLLKTRDGNKFLPIWIGHPEAAAILMKLQGANTPRPMTHDLISDMLSELDITCTRVAVTELRENTFYAEVTLEMNGREIPIDSRPSDALALAVRTGAPIFAAEEVISESAIEFEQAVEVDAGGLRGLGKQAGLGEARDRIGLEDEELAAGLQHEIDAGEAVAAQEAVGAEGEVIRLLRRTFGELGRADEGGATDLVARLEVVEVLVLRNGFDHG